MPRAVGAVDDLTLQRDREHVAAMDDATLLRTLLGLLGEIDGWPEWGRTDRARTITRIAFHEIAYRWIPDDVLVEALRQLEETVDA